MEYPIEFILSHKYESLFLGLTTLGFLIQAFYYLRFYLPLALYKEAKTTETLPPVSVIICARNEAKNLSNNLPKVLAQNYPSGFEVIVVNDASEDDSEYVLAKIKEKNPLLYFTNIPYDKNFSHGKKLALTLGIKAAKNEHLILTDADCCPSSENWLSHMSASLSTKNIVLGFGPYKRKKGFTNRLLRYDTFMIAVQYLSFALKKRPYMAVGRNMGYTKSTFYKTQGFKSHSHILSGDDDLFIQEAATKTNVGISISPESQTISEPSNTFKQWCGQKMRHLSTSPHYKASCKRLLGIEILSRQVFWCSAIISMIFSIFAIPVLILIVLKLSMQILILSRIAKRIEQKSIVWIGMVYDFLLPIITGILLIGSKRNTKRNRWT